MLSVKMACEGDFCHAMQEAYAMKWYVRFGQAWTIYLIWALFYAFVIFVVARKRIERKQRDTLYKYFAYTLGVRDRLPIMFRPYSKLVFMCGHHGLFFCGI